MLENKITEAQWVHYSRYIASWQNSGGTYFGEQFAKWLKANGCTEKEVHDIREMATCGKLELEVSARKFVDRLRKLMEQIDCGVEPEEEP